MKTKILLLIILMFSLCYCSVNKIENSLTKSNIKGQVSNIEVLIYSAIEQLGKIQKGDLKSKRISIYNTNGNEIEVSLYRLFDSIDTKYTYKYDTYGNKLEELQNSSSYRSFDSKTTFKYDTDGNEIEKNVYHFLWYSSEVFPDERLFCKFKSKFDTEGNKLEQNRYNPDGSLDTKYTYKYDNVGNTIEENWFYSEGSLIFKLTYEFDTTGNPIQTNWYNLNGLFSKTTYIYDEYDKTGNWLRRIEYTDDKPKFIEERIIEYFQ